MNRTFVISCDREIHYSEHPWKKYYSNMLSPQNKIDIYLEMEDNQVSSFMHDRFHLQKRSLYIHFSSYKTLSLDKVLSHT